MYEPKGITTTIRATSRVAVKIRENYYTVEQMEERAIPDIEGIDLDAENKALWNSVNKQCDDQIEQIYDMVQNKK